MITRLELTLLKSNYLQFIVLQVQILCQACNFVNSYMYMYIVPLTNRVRRPSCKLWTELFSPLIYGPSSKHTGHKSKGKKRGSVTYSTDRENKVSKIFIISLVCVTDSGKISIHAKRLQISDARRKQNESI